MESVKLNGLLSVVFVRCLKTSCTNTQNTATFIEKQLHISVVYDRHWAINTVF